MALGLPADGENGNPKLRLPLENIFHHNKYDSDKETQRKTLADYDETVSKYYASRTNGERNETWSEQISNFMSAKQRLDMLEQLNKSGFIKK